DPHGRAVLEGSGHCHVAVGVDHAQGGEDRLDQPLVGVLDPHREGLGLHPAPPSGGTWPLPLAPAPTSSCRAWVEARRSARRFCSASCALCSSPPAAGVLPSAGAGTRVTGRREM